MDDFSDYEKHFTVMNYKEDVNLKQIHYDDFIGLFEQQYPAHKWANIQVGVYSCSNLLSIKSRVLLLSKSL